MYWGVVLNILIWINVIVYIWLVLFSVNSDVMKNEKE